MKGVSLRGEIRTACGGMRAKDMAAKDVENVGVAENRRCAADQRKKIRGWRTSTWDDEDGECGECRTRRRTGAGRLTDETA